MSTSAPARVPSGPRNASTDDRTGLRYYEWEGQRLVSMTSLRRLVGMPFPLANWMSEQVVKTAVNNADVLGMIQAAEGFDSAASWLRKESMGERDRAANRGTLVHEAASLGFEPNNCDPEVGLPLIQYYDFIATTKAEVLLSERQIWNLSLGYAGSLDILLKIGPPYFPKVRWLVVDIKTGKNIYVDHAIQIMGYALGEFIGEDSLIDNAATALLHKANGLAVLHLSDTSWELVEIAPTKELHTAFTAMVAFAKWQEANKVVDGLITQRWSK